MVFQLHRTIRYYMLRIIRLRGNPKSLAMGTAIGLFIGISPTIPLHTAAVIGGTILLRVNTVAALIAATIISNPFTMVPQYYLCWRVGNFFFPAHLSWERIKELLHSITTAGFIDSIHILTSVSFDAVLVMLTGGFVIGLPVALAGYFLSLRFFLRIQEKRRDKHLLN